MASKIIASLVRSARSEHCVRVASACVLGQHALAYDPSPSSSIRHTTDDVLGVWGRRHRRNYAAASSGRWSSDGALHPQSNAPWGAAPAASRRRKSGDAFVEGLEERERIVLYKGFAMRFLRAISRLKVFQCVAVGGLMLPVMAFTTGDADTVRTAFERVCATPQHCTVGGTNNTALTRRTRLRIHANSNSSSCPRLWLAAQPA